MFWHNWVSSLHLSVLCLYVTVSLPINLRHDHRMNKLLLDPCNFHHCPYLIQNLWVPDFLLTVKLSVCVTPLTTGYLPCTSQHHKPKMLARCMTPLSLSIGLLMVKKSNIISCHKPWIHSLTNRRQCLTIFPNTEKSIFDELGGVWQFWQHCLECLILSSQLKLKILKEQRNKIVKF